MSHIPSFYRAFFLYVDPVLCFSGIYLAFFDPSTYLLNSTPSALVSKIDTTTAIPPLPQFLVNTIGSFYLFIFSMEALLLRQSLTFPQGLNVKVWRTVMFGILLTDLGLLYGGYRADAETLLDVTAWTKGDWTNNGVLALAIAMRTSFLLGIGGVGKDI
jgi:hypothetical protein